MARPSFDAERYWSARLAESWDLRGVGHREYPASYNRWLYRRKRSVLRRALRGRTMTTAMDLGSGIGWVVQELIAAGAVEVTGVEFAADAIDRLRCVVPDATFVQADVTANPLPATDASVDVVTMLDVAYHVINDAGLAHTVTEVARILRPGGAWLVSDAFGDRELEKAIGADHVRFRTAQQWQSMLSDNGLRLRRQLPYFATLSHPRDDTWRHWWHPRIRGPVEWAMDTALPLRPWLRLAVIERGPDRIDCSSTST